MNGENQLTKWSVRARELASLARDDAERAAAYDRLMDPEGALRLWRQEFAARRSKT